MALCGIFDCSFDDKIIIPCNYLSVKKLLGYLNIIFSALSYQLHIVCLLTPY